MVREISAAALALAAWLGCAAAVAAPAPKNKPPVVALTSPSPGAVFSAPAAVTLSATASDPDGTVAKVDFLRGSTLIASVTTAPYTFNWTGVAAGSYSITAKATDNKGATASSAAASITVTAPQPATIISSPANGSSLSFGNTVDVTGSFVGTAQTTILVHSAQAGSTVLATQTSATTFQARAVPLVTGVNTLTARAIRKDGTSSVGTITVNVPSLMAVMTAPATGGTYSAGSPLTLRASVGTATGAIQKVEYFRTFVGSLGSTTTAPYTLTLNPAAGDYSVFARVTGTAGNTADSQAISFSVLGPNQLPTATLTSPTTGQSFVAPASFTLQANASDPDGSIVSLEFLRNGQVIGAYSTAPYTHAVSNLAAGTYTFAARATDNRGGVTTSASASVSVNAPSTNPPRVTLVAPAESIPTSVSLTAIVTPGDSAIQRVEFHANEQLIETRTEEPYAVSWPITATGTYVVTATAYDTAGAGTISTPATVPVTDGITYLHTDIAGNVIAASDSAGNQIWKESFRPYGERLNNRLESAGNRQWFHGKEGDAETGLSYFGARYYDPVLGRFMGVDPVGFEHTNAQSFNRYAFGNNNPYRYTDPDGNVPVLIIPLLYLAGYMGTGAAVAGGFNAAAQLYMTGKVQWGGIGGVLDAAGDGAILGPLAIRAPTAATPTPIAVTESSIAGALKGSDMKTTQGGLSKPVVERYVRRLEAGEIAPAIKVDGKTIVDGNHRYAAGRLAGKEPAQVPGTAAPSQAAKARPVQNLKIDSADWGNR